MTITPGVPLGQCIHPRVGESSQMILVLQGVYCLEVGIFVHRQQRPHCLRIIELKKRGRREGAINLLFGRFDIFSSGHKRIMPAASLDYPRKFRGRSAPSYGDFENVLLVPDLQLSESEYKPRFAGREVFVRRL